ncbi:aminoglycoside phosphotransferase family protein [Candidatus Bipolaricaulota bacterium]|nr:aminoglycoside phosphotransferase family protein [Candidatus Bipolaricaulota bacterium]
MVDLESVLRDLGLNPREVRVLAVISRSAGTRLYRLRIEGKTYVLKRFLDEDAREPRAYDLLRDLGVPTLPVHDSTLSALLLEDLDASPTWRLAHERDVAHRELGRAVAEWYQFLHIAGKGLVKRGPPDWLRWEWDDLTPEGILRAGKVLAMEENPVWEYAARHVEALRARARELPTTLNYNDFHWTNLALSRQPPLRAIVFDYHLLGIGLAWSDVRNVTHSLGPAAREAFLDAYGPTRPEERILDEPLSVLHALQVATARPTIPRWAVESVNRARSGALLAALERAVALLGGS